MNFATQLSCWPSLWLSVDCQNWIGNGMPAWNSSILSTQFDFSNWNRIKLFKLSMDSNPQTINCNRCRKSRKCDTVAALAALAAGSALLDAVGFPVPLGTPRYHTFVIVCLSRCLTDRLTGGDCCVLLADRLIVSFLLCLPYSLRPVHSPCAVSTFHW